MAALSEGPESGEFGICSALDDLAIEGKGDVAQLSDWGPGKLMLSQGQTDPSPLPSPPPRAWGTASSNRAKVPFLHFLHGLPPPPLPPWQQTPREDSVTLTNKEGACDHARPASSVATCAFPRGDSWERDSYSM